MSDRTPKEIGRLAGRRFAATIPANWAIRSQEDQEDYGVDYEIELTTADDKATGFIFKVQQKGVEHAARLVDGTVAFRLETEKVTYYLHHLRIPFVLVVVDLESGSSYWTPLHANREIEKAHDDAIAANQATMTVRLPATNILPRTHDALLASVRQMLDALTLAALKKMPTADTQRIIDSDPDLDTLERSLRMTQSLIRSTRTQKLLERGSLDEAFELNKTAFGDGTEPPEARFAAGIELVRIGDGIVVRRGGDASDREALLKLRLEVQHRLVVICRTLPFDHQLRFYSLFLARCSRLRVLVDRDVGLHFSRLAQQADPDELAEYTTVVAQRRSILAMTRELHHAQRLLANMIDKGWIGLVVYAWSELTEAIQPFLMRLGQERLGAGAAAIREWLDHVGSLCRVIVVELDDATLVEVCAINHLRIGLGAEDFARRSDEARALVAKISDASERAAAQAQVDKLVELGNEGPGSGNDRELDDRELEQVVRQMARGLGINIDDPNDDIARVVRIGIRDANPDRVVRECKQLLVQLGSSGIPAQMLGLPTAGFKFLSCKKHGYRSSALSLDDLYGFFKAQHCDACPDRNPHPANWKWTRDYQKTEELASRTSDDSP